MQRLTLFIHLSILCSGGLPAVGQDIRFEIDASLIHPISPYIYGANPPAWQRHKQLYTLTRWAGNRSTTYNWENNASNAGADFHNQNDGLLSNGNAPGDPVARLTSDAIAARSSIVITVPILGLVARDKLADGDVSKSADFINRRFMASLPRKGLRLSQKPDEHDLRVFQDEFVNWLETAFPPTKRTFACSIFYALDNEPDLWPANHPRIHPQKTRLEEIVKLNVDYATAIKNAAPRSMVFGPCVRGCDSLRDSPDAQGRDFIEFYMRRMHEAEVRTGRRLLDVLDLHWYPEPQGDGMVITSDDAHPELSTARIQSPRALWDPAYVEQPRATKLRTHDPIRLLPSLREKIAKNYKNLRLAITEYYFGGGDDISGALAQADALGIFGRESVFVAAIRPLGKSEDRFTGAAFAMFRNYDGQGNSFGDVGLFAKTNDSERTSIYASADRQGRIVLVALNKTPTPLLVKVAIRRCPPSNFAQVYQLTASKPEPVRVSDALLDPTGRFHCQLPGRSISTMILLEVRQGR